MGNGILGVCAPYRATCTCTCSVCTLLFTHAPLGDWLTISVTFLVMWQRIAHEGRRALQPDHGNALRHTGRTLDLAPLSAYAL